MIRAETVLSVGGEDLLITGEVELPAVLAGPRLAGGEVRITGVWLDGPTGNRPLWSGTLCDVDEERAKDALLEDACYRDMVGR